ncbi:glutamate--tRNA ligase [bacterium]|nr:glutamate--tRNA ligase [bacterium]MBU1063558.1 glutamate--tRNA ligase [bacterium]MBU1635399.1 glutamate--tRNA ligase [bacterium]MBU1874367.1 glutamate--tRNA ligase [bacterium]
MGNIRVRFAPSPTGVLHLGGARSAIYNWLFARAEGGKFLLRIEDTDAQRSKSEYVEQIYKSLRWLGLDWDDEPVFQSKRMDAYQESVQKMVDDGSAYYCFCTPEELEERRKASGDYSYDGKCRSLSKTEIDANLKAEKSAAVRFKIETGTTEWIDRVYGTIKVNHREIDDFVIQRSNGFPTYQLAVVVDDIFMRISHVIRGEDHISNTPKQILLYKALGAAIPEFAHLPLLNGTDGKRLSKRHGATGVDEYRDQGYPTEAVFNYLAILGWVPKDGNEILNPDDLIKRFNLDDIARKSAIFDLKKFDWVSNEHIKKTDPEEIYRHILPILVENDLVDAEPDSTMRQYILKFIDLMRNRFRTYQQFGELGSYFFKDPETYEEKAVRKNWKDREVNRRMETFLAKLKALEDFTGTTIETVVRELAEELEISAGNLIHPVRLAVSGFSVGPGIFELLEVLGKETVLRRVHTALHKLPLID